MSSSMAADTGDPRAPDMRGLGITQLLKQASRRRTSSAGNSGSGTTAGANSVLGSMGGGGLEMAIARLTGSGALPNCLSLVLRHYSCNTPGAMHAVCLNTSRLRRSVMALPPSSCWQLIR